MGKWEGLGEVRLKGQLEGLRVGLGIILSAMEVQLEQGCLASPGEIGGEGEAGVDRCLKVKILRAREAGDAEAEWHPATRSQQPRGTAELWRRAGKENSWPSCLPSHRPLPTMSHLQKDWHHSAKLGRNSVEALAPSILADQLKGEGSSVRNQRGRQRGHQEPSFCGSHRLQEQPAQLGALGDPSEDHMGEMWPSFPSTVPGAQSCHFYQQLSLETWADREGRGEK